MVKFFRLNALVVILLSLTTQSAAAEVLEQVTHVVEQSTETADQQLEQVLQQADENAVKFGLSRAEKDAAAKRSERETRLLDGNKRDPEKPT